MTRSKALRLLREHRDFTQKRLADASGINKATISDYERCKREIGPENLRRMLDALGWTTRAWEATLRHVEWLDWLLARERGAGGEESGSRWPPPGVPSQPAWSTDLGDPAVLRNEVARIAELAGRERERRVTALLELVAHLAVP